MEPGGENHIDAQEMPQDARIRHDGQALQGVN
jgi:hypothetical protein